MSVRLMMLWVAIAFLASAIVLWYDWYERRQQKHMVIMMCADMRARHLAEQASADCSDPDPSEMAEFFKLVALYRTSLPAR